MVRFPGKMSFQHASAVLLLSVLFLLLQVQNAKTGKSSGQGKD